MTVSGVTSTDWAERYRQSLLGVYGPPSLVISHGRGRHVYDVDGRRYLDLVGGIAVNALGHGHPALVQAITDQAARVVHVSNLLTSPPQIELAERLLQVLDAPQPSRVFLCNSGAEANEAAIKLARRTGRSRIVAAQGAFHGRTTGALALTAKEEYRAPFAPLLPGVHHVPFGEVAALDAAVDHDTSAVILEPIQGEAGVVLPPPGYLAAAREITAAAGALLILDEIQTGVGRTGTWWAHQQYGVRPDAVTVAKGLAGGVPVGALVVMGPGPCGLLGAGQHGTTFGGNPLAAAAALAVLATIEGEDLLTRVAELGRWLQEQVRRLEHPMIAQVRGAGLLQAVVLREPIAHLAAARARERGVLVNPVAAQVLRLAPPLTVTQDELATFVDILPEVLTEPAPVPQEST